MAIAARLPTFLHTWSIWTLFILLNVFLIDHSTPTTIEQYNSSLNNNPRSSLDHFIEIESRIALSRIDCNIGPSGSCVQGTNSGLVVAGPGKANPDYFYTWTRDAALTIKSMVDQIANEYDTSLQTHIQNYISSQVQLQVITNPSGDLYTGTGLGEPKFNVDATPFMGSWGRPQRDGPALRAIAMITYSKWLITAGYNSTARDMIWPLIQNDLNYIAQYWNQTGFDLWEEVYGSSFFTASAQYRALVEGSNLALLLGKACPLCKAQMPQVLCFLQTFWDPVRGYILANINENSGRSSKDASTILASIHQFDPSALCDSRTFQPCSDLALANHKIVTDSFRSIYPLNAGILAGKAVSVGRYPEDIYYNGNPWYITTLAAAEQLYDALYVWKKLKSINITNISLAFFRDFNQHIQIGSYNYNTPEYQVIFRKISSYADEFMKIVETFAQINGSLSEQFDKVSGKPLSAFDLTWSYVGFITASTRRSGSVPYSWVNDNSTDSIIEVPSICAATSERGSYSSAPIPTWPPNQTPPSYMPEPIITSSSTSSACVPATTVLVNFNELITTSYGDTIKILGSDLSVGNWDLEHAVALSADHYSMIYPLWRVTLPLRAGSTIKYKYINVKPDLSVYWEGGSDHTLDVPKGCETVISVIENWQYEN